MMLLVLSSCNKNTAESSEQLSNDQEEHIVISQEDEPYMILLTDNYKTQSVEEFDTSFLPYYLFYTGYGRSHPEQEFMKSLSYAVDEIVAEGNGEIPGITLDFSNEDKSVGYTLYWDISNPSLVTVEQRDKAINDCRSEIALLSTTITDNDISLQKTLDEIAEKNSSEHIAIIIKIEEANVS